MLDRISMGKDIAAKHLANPAKGPRIVLFTGGTGSRFLARELTKYTHNACYIINVTDNGKSTGHIRRLLDIPAIGDLRSRLIDLADRQTPGHEENTTLLKYRFDQKVDPQWFEHELAQMIAGEHDLVRAILRNPSASNAKANANIICTHLFEFQTQRFRAC